MGNSSSGRHADGLALYGAENAWTPAIVAAWPQILARSRETWRARHSPGAAVAANSRGGVGVGKKARSEVDSAWAESRGISTERADSAKEWERALRRAARHETGGRLTRATALAIHDMVLDALARSPGGGDLSAHLAKPRPRRQRRLDETT